MADAPRRRWFALLGDDFAPRTSLVRWATDDHDHGRRSLGRTVLTVAPNGVGEWHAHVKDTGSHRLSVTVHRHGTSGLNIEGPPVGYTQTTPVIAKADIERQLVNLLEQITDMTNPTPAPAGTTSKEDETHE